MELFVVSNHSTHVIQLIQDISTKVQALKLVLKPDIVHLAVLIRLR
jgi:hypothetical protein